MPEERTFELWTIWPKRVFERITHEEGLTLSQALEKGKSNIDAGAHDIQLMEEGVDY